MIKTDSYFRIFVNMHPTLKPQFGLSIQKLYRVFI